MKGRDIYDLIWYLGDPSRPPPNLELLNDALRRTGWEGGSLSLKNWRKVVREKVRDIAWEQVEEDVSPFLGAEADTAILNKQNLLRLLS